MAGSSGDTNLMAVKLLGAVLLELVHKIQNFFSCLCLFDGMETTTFLVFLVLIRLKYETQGGFI